MPGSFRSGRTLSRSSVGRGGVGSAGRFGAGKFGGGKFGQATPGNNATGGQPASGSDRFRAQSPWVSSRKSPWGPTGKSPWSGMGKNFQEAIFGKGKPENNEKIETDRNGRRLPDGILEMQIKIDDGLDGDRIKYNPRKNTVSVGGEYKLSGNKLSKDIITLARKSSKFRKETGIGTVSGKKRSQLNTALRRKASRLRRANQRLQSSSVRGSRPGSSSRKITFGDLIK